MYVFSFITTVAVILLGLTTRVRCTDPALNLSLALSSINMLRVGDTEDSGKKAFSKSQNTLIIAGEESKSGQFPYLGSLQILDNSSKRYHICGCVLITPNKVMTAAHCMVFYPRYEHFVALGYHRLSTHGEALIKVKEVLIHPRYEPYDLGFPNDMAILTLETLAPLGPKVQLANLSMPGESEFKGMCTIAGWGEAEGSYYPDELRYGQLFGLTNYECILFFKIFGPVGLRSFHKCAWYWPWASCYGDSGGPLICNNKVYGITSWSADCSGCHPTVFSRVSEFYNWIFP